MSFIFCSLLIEIENYFLRIVTLSKLSIFTKKVLELISQELLWSLLNLDFNIIKSIVFWQKIV